MVLSLDFEHVHGWLDQLLVDHYIFELALELARSNQVRVKVALNLGKHELCRVANQVNMWVDEWWRVMKFDKLLHNLKNALQRIQHFVADARCHLRNRFVLGFDLCNLAKDRNIPKSEHPTLLLFKD
jgi:hypothetical protein